MAWFGQSLCPQQSFLLSHQKEVWVLKHGGCYAERNTGLPHMVNIRFSQKEFNCIQLISGSVSPSPESVGMRPVSEASRIYLTSTVGFFILGSFNVLVRFKLECSANRAYLPCSSKSMYSGYIMIIQYMQ